MAIKKYQLNRKNASGTYDTIHYETSSTIVKRPDGTTVEEALLNNSLPSGIIAMWSGSADTIPSGWALCDGSNGTPNLRNRFIVGAGGTYTVGATGGSDSVALATSNMPSHTHGHSLSVASGGAHTHTYSGTTSSAGSSSGSSISGMSSSSNSNNYSSQGLVASGNRTGTTLWTMGVGASNHTHTYSGNTGSGGAHTHSLSGSISNAGSGAAHENRPPYYALCFIMKK